MSEEWRPLPDWPGYEISDLGRVRSTRGGNGSRIIKLHPDKHGRLSFGLSNPGRRYTMAIATAVLRAFVGPKPSNYHQCCHRDDDKTNNRLDNLYWGTQRENNRDRARNGLTPAGERHGRSKLTGVQVDQIRKRVNAGESQVTLAKEFGVGSASISRLMNRDEWKLHTALQERDKRIEELEARLKALGEKP